MTCPPSSRSKKSRSSHRRRVYRPPGVRPRAHGHVRGQTPGHGSRVRSARDGVSRCGLRTARFWHGWTAADGQTGGQTPECQTDMAGARPRDMSRRDALSRARRCGRGRARLEVGARCGRLRPGRARVRGRARGRGRCPLPSARRPAQVDGLRGDHEPDRERGARPVRPSHRSRRAASGAIVIRSSIPSAWVDDTSSKETGWASRRASAVSAWPATLNSLSEFSTSPWRGASPSGRPVCGPLQELHHPLAGTREHRRERDAEEVERAREGERVGVRRPRRSAPPRGSRAGSPATR